MPQIFADTSSRQDLQPVENLREGIRNYYYERLSQNHAQSQVKQEREQATNRLLAYSYLQPVPHRSSRHSPASESYPLTNIFSINEQIKKIAPTSSGGVNFCNQYENVLITPYFFVINWLFFCSQYEKFRNQYEKYRNQYEKKGNQYEKKG